MQPNFTSQNNVVIICFHVRCTTCRWFLFIYFTVITNTSCGVVKLPDNKKYDAKARKSNISTYPISLHLFSAIFLSFCDFDHKPVALFGRYDGVVFRFSLTPYGDTRASAPCEHLHFLWHFVLCRVDIFMRKILLTRVSFRRSGLCKTNCSRLFLEQIFYSFFIA